MQPRCRIITRDWFVRIVTCLLGMVLTDAFLVARALMLSKVDVGLVDFALEVADGLIDCGRKSAEVSLPSVEVESNVEEDICYYLSFGQKEVTREDGTVYTKKIQRWCSECPPQKRGGFMTTTYCGRCGVPVCTVGTRTCWQNHTKRVHTKTQGRKRRKVPPPS